MFRSMFKRFNKSLLLAAIVSLWLVPANCSLAWQSAAKPAGSDTKEVKNDKTADQDDDTPRPLAPWEKFVPDVASMDLAGTENRAWEYRPYKVACWFCLDGSPRANSLYPKIAQEVADRSELLDASGWTLAIGQAPPKYRNQFLKFINTPDRCVGFTEHEVLNEYDKIMVVCLSDQASQIRATVREFDIQTQQWGPINNQKIPFGRSAGQQLMNAIANSFMPLAQIERVTAVEMNVNGKKQMKDEVLMQLRAVRSCVTTELTEITTLAEPEETETGADSQGTTEQSTNNAEAVAEGGVQEPTYKQFEISVVPASSSPVFIRKSDLFLPVIRRTDRAGNLKGLEPLEFTFLTVDKQEGAEVRASIQSTGRNPLGQRKSKKAKKLALVIRPPQNSTTLQLLSREKQPIPMEGFTIKEVPVGAPRTVTGVPIGRSDYQGKFEVMPSDSGMRVLVISRGGRNLKKLPIVPGLYDSVETKLPNDEVRLFSHGVFKGFETEILGLIIQRQVVRANLEKSIEKKLRKNAELHLRELRELESLEQFRERFRSSVNELKAKTSDKRELKYIDARLISLNKLIGKTIKSESSIHYDKETKTYGKNYQEQIFDLPKAKREANKS